MEDCRWEMGTKSLVMCWKATKGSPEGVRRVGTSESNEGILCPDLACIAVASQPLHLIS
jgi:hypothetical protein